MDTIKNYSLYLMISILLVFLSEFLESEYIICFLEENLLLILIALFAINVTSVTVLMTKLKEISDLYNNNFKKTIESLKASFKEQFLLIICSGVSVVIFNGKLLIDNFELLGYFKAVVYLSIFLSSIYILYDTSKSIFLILEFEDDESENEE